MQPGVDPLGERRAGRQGEELGQPVAQRIGDRDSTVGAADADMDVEAERVVLPHDVAEDLVIATVVRRVDDPLVLPVRPWMGAGCAEGEPERLDKSGELDPALGDQCGHVRERLDTPRLDLRLRGDQLTDQVRLGRGVTRCLLHVLEAIDEIEARRIEESELFLHGDREVVCRLVALACLHQQLVVSHLLLVTHGAKRVVDPAVREGRATGCSTAAASECLPCSYGDTAHGNTFRAPPHGTRSAR